MPLIYDGNMPKNITYNGNEVRKVVCNDDVVWEKAGTVNVLATATRGWNSSDYPTAKVNSSTTYIGACNTSSKRAAIIQFARLGNYPSPTSVILRLYRLNTGSYYCRFVPRDDYLNWSINTVISYSTSQDSYEVPGASGGWVDVDITELWPTILEALNADDGTVWLCIKNNYNTMSFDGDVTGDNCPYLIITN